MTELEYKNLPKEIKAIVDSRDEDAQAYAECARIHAELKTKGWGCSYGLDGVICDVQKLKKR